MQRCEFLSCAEYAFLMWRDASNLARSLINLVDVFPQRVLKWEWSVMIVT